MSKKSKIIIGIVIAVILFFVFAGFVIQNNRSNLSAEDVITSFYRSWIRENETPGSAFERNVHVRSTYASESLAQDVSRLGLYIDGTFAFDPVVCGSIQQGEPGVNMVYEDLEEGRARAVLTDISSGPVNVYAVKGENGWWYVDEIDCPAGSMPEVPREVADDEAGGTSTDDIVSPQGADGDEAEGASTGEVMLETTLE